MAELEALAEIKATPPGGSSPSIPGQYTWRYILAVNKTIRIGSDASQSDWVVPEDKMISRFHATVEWDGAKLTVLRRPSSPEFPKPPQNHIWFRNNPVEKCEVRTGEWFVIGQTRFAVRGEGDSGPASPVDATVVQRKEEFTRAELENLQFSNPQVALKAMERLPHYLRGVKDEAGLFRQVLKVVLDGLVKADAAAVVRLPTDSAPGDPRIAVVEQNVRGTHAALAGEFVPSRKLARQAFKERKSCLHIWSTEPGDVDPTAGADHTMTLGAMHQTGATPWAVCTPFQDGPPFALYVSGRIPPGASADTAKLIEFQKFIEIMVGILETTRRGLQLARQYELAKLTWPRAIRKYLDDPERLEAMLKPQEKEVTVLFCDLRGYSGYAEAKGSNLHEAWKEIQAALNVMSGAVTDKGGIVAGFRGDAVLGFWGWPDPQKDQVEKAAEAALSIHERLSGWMIERKSGLGLTHGKALAGRLGAHDLAVLDLYGPVVNLAFRLEEMTKAFGVGIIISDEVAKRLDAADSTGGRWRTRRLSKVRPRGMKTPLHAYELMPGGTQEGLNYLWDETIDLFIGGNWIDAHERLQESFFDDPAGKCIVRYIEYYNRMPPSDWLTALESAFTPKPPE